MVDASFRKKGYKYLVIDKDGCGPGLTQKWEFCDPTNAEIAESCTKGTTSNQGLVNQRCMNINNKLKEKTGMSSYDGGGRQEEHSRTQENLACQVLYTIFCLYIALIYIFSAQIQCHTSGTTYIHPIKQMSPYSDDPDLAVYFPDGAWCANVRITTLFMALIKTDFSRRVVERIFTAWTTFVFEGTARVPGLGRRLSRSMSLKKKMWTWVSLNKKGWKRLEWTMIKGQRND